MLVEKCSIIRAVRDRGAGTIDAYVRVSLRPNARCAAICRVQLVSVRLSELRGTGSARQMLLCRAVERSLAEATRPDRRAARRGARPA